MNIIFDLCGPLIKIDVERINHDLHEYGLPSLRGYHDLHDAGLIKQYDTGLVTPEQFVEQACNVWGYTMSESLIWKAWNNVVYDFDVRHVHTVKSLRNKGMKTFVLSNSDIVNARHFCEFMNQKAGFDFTGDCFDALFFSYQLHCRKPDPEVFRKILELGNLDPQDSLFIDDSRKNCIAAQEVGLRVHHLTDEEQIEDVVADML